MLHLYRVDVVKDFKATVMQYDYPADLNINKKPPLLQFTISSLVFKVLSYTIIVTLYHTFFWCCFLCGMSMSQGNSCVLRYVMAFSTAEVNNDIITVKHVLTMTHAILSTPHSTATP